MNSALEILRRERDDAAEQIRALRARIRDLDNAIGVLEGQPLISKVGRGSGDLKQIVLTHLERDGGGDTPKEIAEALTSQGRPTTDATVSSTLSRLKGESKVINRSGRWFAAKTLPDSQSAESDLAHASLSDEQLTNSSEWDDLDDVPF